MSNLRDATIRTFIGAGLNNCAGGLYPGPDYEAGLVELRDRVFAGDPGFASYYVNGIDHTFLPFPTYGTQVSGVFLVDWIAALLAGNVTHVSP